MTIGTPSPRPSWHSMSSEQALAWLDARVDGLSDVEAEARLRHHGPNNLQQATHRPWWRRLIAQFANLLMIIVLVAALVSLLLGQPLDATAILGVVAVVALIGFIQEGKAEKALERIREMLAPRAQVLRGGRRCDLPAETLVPGDIVLLESGDRVPADLRLLEARRLRHQEAALTGESTPVDKHSLTLAEDTYLAERRCMAYAGTLVVQGSARGLVVATGPETEVGSINQLLRDVETLRTPLLRQLDQAGRMLGILIMATAVLTALVGIVVHGSPWPEMFMVAVGLAVAAIPEGMPAIATIGLALGVQAMARRNAIIRRLPAVETLGSVSTIFTDKTGTLTRNEMTAQVIWLPEGEIRIGGVGFAPQGDFHRVRDSVEEATPLSLDDLPGLRHFLTIGVLCNDAELAREDGQWCIHGDPTEGALVVAAAKAGLDVRRLRGHIGRHDAIPFESERLYMATLHAVDGASLLLVKGAPDRLLTMCHGVRTETGKTALERDVWSARVQSLSAQGLRVLALAEKPMLPEDHLDDTHVEQGLVLLGLVALLDPPREEARDAVAQCRAAGIRPIMVTGDHADTARAIAAQLGFLHTERAVDGRALEAMSDAALAECVQRVDVYSRAAPEHKLRLVKALQASGEICAMTGDGVNDGPALKRADVGVAMGRQGTAAAREAAEIVLADDDFATILRAVREGRKVYDNIRKTIAFLLPTNGAQGLVIMFAVLAGSVLPVTPLQVLWVNMVVAGTLGLALAFESGEHDLMRRSPRAPSAPLLDFFMLWRVVFVSALLLLATFGVFAWIHDTQGGDIALARAGAVNMLVAGCAAYLINSRYLVHSNLSWRGFFGSRPVWITIGLAIAIQLAWTYIPLMQRVFGIGGLSLEHWTVIMALALALFLTVEAEKALRRQSTNVATRFNLWFRR